MDDFFVTYLPKNLKYILIDAPIDREKHMLELFRGYLTRSQLQRRRGELLGRVFRWRHFSEFGFAIILNVCCDMVAYLRMGYDFRCIRKLWS